MTLLVSFVVCSLALVSWWRVVFHVLCIRSCEQFLQECTEVSEIVPRNTMVKIVNYDAYKEVTTNEEKNS